MQPLPRATRFPQDFQRLQALDVNRDQRLQVQELRALDRDGDGILQSQEVAGFQSSALRSQLQQRYVQGQAQPNLAIFDLKPNAQQAQAATRLEQHAQKLEKGLREQVTSFTRTLLNGFDTNGDDALSVAEVRAISLPKALRLGEDFGLTTAQVKQIVKQLHQLAQIRATQAPPNHDPRVLGPSPDSDFASGMRYLDDPAAEALSTARLQDPAALRAKLAQEASPAVQKLLPQLQALGGEEAENLVLLQHFLRQHPPAVTTPIVERIQTWLVSSAEPPAAIAASERAEYLNGVLHTLAYPEDVDQAEKGTCAAAALEMELARQDPAQYTELALTLAQGQPFRLLDTPQGEVRRMYPNQSFRGDADDGRSLASRLVQNSLMDLGHQAGENDSHRVSATGLSFYDSRLSVDSAQGLDANAALKAAAERYPELRTLPAPLLDRLSDGMSTGEMLYVGQGLFGAQWQDWAEQDEQGRLRNGEALMTGVDQALANGRQFTIGSEDHAMLLLGKHTRAGQHFYVVSSWSGRYEMTPAALQQRLTNVLGHP